MEEAINKSWLKRFSKPKPIVLFSIYIIPSLLVLLDMFFLTGINLDVGGFGNEGEYGIHEFTLVITWASCMILIGVLRSLDFSRINRLHIFNIAFLYLSAGVVLTLIPSEINIYWMLIFPLGFLGIMYFGRVAVFVTIIYTVIIEAMFLLLRQTTPGENSYYYVLPVILYACLEIANVFNETILYHYNNDKKSKSLLETEYQKTLTLINNVDDSMVALNKSLDIIVFNQAFLGMVSKANLRANSPVDSLFTLIGEKSMKIRISDLIKDNKYHARLKFRPNNNPKLNIDVEVRISKINDKSGSLQGYALLISDITQQVELNHKKDEFISIASHELRTPMTIINGHATILQKGTFGKLNEKQLHYVERIRDSSKHLIGLVGDMLDLSKLEAGKIDINLSEINCKFIVEQQVEVFKNYAEQNKIELSSDLAEELMVIADGDRLKQIITNLLSNAVKYTPEGGSVNVKVETYRADRSMALIVVKDSGIGISKKDQESLFKKFSQIDSVLARETEGTGLGLVIVKQLATLMGGKIWVDSTPGVGSSFMLTLPKIDP